MSADPVIYCLEHLTDYLQFERLCSDVMAATIYPNIEPIGGTGDRGRDALHIDITGNKKTIFAYSVRSDWRSKLSNDCERIATEEHNPDEVVFVCTATLSGDNRDKERNRIHEKYGWSIDFYDLERLRVLLSGPLRHLLAVHPAIFCPPWFPRRGGLSIAESRDTLVIDHAESDHAFAVWLSRRLSTEGYKTWCYGTAPLAGEDADSSIRELIETRAAQYLPILSTTALSNGNLMARAAIASSKPDLIIPCTAKKVSLGSSFSKLFQAEPAHFEDGWSVGLAALLPALENRGMRPDLPRDQGQSIALRAYMPEPLTKPEKQLVHTNVFPVSIPKSLLICELSRNLDDLDIQSLRNRWAFVKASDKTLLAFDHPPPEVPVVKGQRLAEFAWDSYYEREGVKTVNAIKQLIRRTAEIACARRGLIFCPDRQVFYFPMLDDKPVALPLTFIDGVKTRVSMTGERQWGYGDRATTIRYQLGPKFKVTIDEQKNWWITTRVYVRVTDDKGVPFEDRRIGPRRKKVTRSWWNRQWSARTLEIMQALRTNEGDEYIEVGAGKRKVCISVFPLSWECPIAIDVEAVDKIGDIHEELAALSYVNDDEEQID
ncbi:MAG: hypothetical protein R3E74_09915 [Pseudomonadales bacterium]